MQRTPIKKISDKQRERMKVIPKLHENDAKIYLEIWNERERFCEECGTEIKESKLFNYHHLLPKKDYEELRHNKENIALVCWQCHDQAEKDIFKTPILRERTENLKKEYPKNRLIKKETNLHGTTRKILFNKKTGKCEV